VSIASAIELMDRFYAATDEATAAHGRPITCYAGCFHCCREPVMAERGEVEYLVAAIPPEEREAVVERTRVCLNGFFEAGQDKMPNPEDLRGKGFAALLAYRSAGLWCPLLKNGLCLAYKARPLSCRHHRASGPESACQNDAERPSQVFVSTEQDSEFLRTVIYHQLEANPKDPKGRGRLELDHLGLYLAHILLGETRRSEAAQDVNITYTD